MDGQASSDGSGPVIRWLTILLLACTGRAAVAQTPDAATQTATQPVTQTAPSNLERLNEQVALLEDPRNPPETRRAIARNLLLDHWPETPNRLATLLGGSNAPAKIAVARALSELPQYLDASYIDPLIALLGDQDADVRASAGSALAASHSASVVPRLRDRALDRDQPRQTRLGAIGALGQMIEREAIDALAEALNDPDAGIASAALDGLQRAAAIDVGDDRDAALQWWEATRSLSDEAWHRQQVERLVQKDRETRARLNAIESRLFKVLEANFQKSTDAERAAQLADYLADPTPGLRQLGLMLVQKHLGEGKPLDSLPKDVVARVREMLSSKLPAEQAAAVRTVASFRKPEDSAVFEDMLKTSKSRDVRLALINGLGYLGDDACVPTLLGALKGAEPETATEVFAALGRLAERDAVTDATRASIVAALNDAFAHTAGTQAAMRERILWAMGNVADPSFGPALAAGLDRAEAIAVRQQAVRGIAILKDPKLADALANAVNDADVVVRQTAVDTLASIGSSDRHLQALLSRVSSPPETDEGVRQSAWRGALNLIATRPEKEVDGWLNRLPGDDRQRAQRTAEVLQRLIRLAEGGRNGENGHLCALRTRLGGVLSTLGQWGDALAAYQAALADTQDADTASRVKIAVELLRAALLGGQYDEGVAATLAKIDLSHDADAYWRLIRTEIEPRLVPAEVVTARRMLSDIRRWPPCTWSQEASGGLSRLEARAAQVVASQPAEGGTTQPTVSTERGTDRSRR